MNQQPAAKVLNSTPLYEGFLKLRRYDFAVDKHAGGTQHLTREVMERGHAVAVLGYDPVLDVVVLVNEFRPGCLIAGDAPFTDTLPAGGIASGEDALQAAVREMKEETALNLHGPILVHPGAYVSSGGTSEKIAIVAGLVDASAAGGVHGNGDELEDILTVVLPAAQFIERAKSARITDMKTLLAGYWLADHRERLRGASRRGM